MARTSAKATQAPPAMTPALISTPRPAMKPFEAIRVDDEAWRIWWQFFCKRIFQRVWRFSFVNDARVVDGSGGGAHFNLVHRVGRQVHQQNFPVDKVSSSVVLFFSPYNDLFELPVGLVTERDDVKVDLLEDLFGSIPTEVNGRFVLTSQVVDERRTWPGYVGNQLELFRGFALVLPGECL